jgi:hypothetical protein
LEGSDRPGYVHYLGNFLGRDAHFSELIGMLSKGMLQVVDYLKSTMTGLCKGGQVVHSHVSCYQQDSGGWRSIVELWLLDVFLFFWSRRSILYLVLLENKLIYGRRVALVGTTEQLS